MGLLPSFLDSSGLEDFQDIILRMVLDVLIGTLLFLLRTGTGLLSVEVFLCLFNCWLKL